MEEKKYRFESTHPIWSVWIDEASEKIILEHRTPDLSFTVLAGDTKVYSHSHTWDIPTLVSVNAVHEGKVLYTYYYDHSNPLSIGIGVYDLYSQALIWEIGGYSLYAFDPSTSTISCYSNQLQASKKYLDFNTGNEVAAFQKVRSEIRQPITYLESSPYHHDVHLFLSNRGYNTNGPIQYLSLESSIIIGFEYDEKLVIIEYDKKGECLQKISLDKKKDAVCIFFTFKKRIFIVNNKIELLTYALKREV